MADKEKKVAETEKKASKPKKKKGKIKEAWRGFKSEVKKIVWPSAKQVTKNTAVVLLIVVICGIAIIALDFAFSRGLMGLTELITKLTAK